MRILFVDDEKSLAFVLQHELKECGYEVDHVDNGVDAVMQFIDAAAPYDMVVLDMRLPMLDGMHVLKIMKKINPAVPVVCTSGYMEENEKEEAFETGAAAFIPKPFQIGQLKHELMRHRVQGGDMKEQRRHILLMEEDPRFRVAVAVSLKQAGYQVTEAESGSTAFEVLKKKRDEGWNFSLLLISVQISSVSGMELIRALRGNAFSIPILVMCGSFDRELIRKLVDHNCTEIIVKPFEPSDLLDYIASLLDEERQAIA